MSRDRACLLNGLFCSTEWAVSDCGMGRFAMRFGPYQIVSRAALARHAAVGIGEGGPWRVGKHTRVLRGRGSQIARNVWRNGIKVLILRLVTKNHYLLFISLIK